MAVDTVFGRSGDVVALAGDYASFYTPLDSMMLLPIGGTIGQVPTKKSDDPFDVDWETPTPYVPVYTAEDVANKVTSFGVTPTDTQYPSALLVSTALATKLGVPVAITPGTHTKITYDANGLVTAGVDATTADIAESTDKRYITESQHTALLGLSGTNTGDQDLSSYALASDLTATNAAVAGLSSGMVNYALVSDLAATNTALGDVTASLANYALASDLVTTNAAISDLADAVVAGYTPIDQFNTLQDNFNALVADLGAADYESSLTFTSGLTRVDNTVTSDVVTNPVLPYTFLGNASSSTAFPATFVQIAAEFLSNGVTGTGAVVLASSPSISTPVLVGPANVKLSDSGVSTAPTVLIVEHEFVGGGSIVAGFGATLEFRGRSTTTSGRTEGAIRTVWTNPTDGSRTSNMVFSPVSAGLAVDTLWLHGDGSMALGANAGSGNGVLWLQDGIQMPGAGTAGMVLRDNGTGTFVPHTLDAAEVTGQVSTCPTVKTTTTDQTNPVEATHFSVPIAAGSVVGTTWKVTAWGNLDNGATLTQFLMSVRWGGLTGTGVTSSSVIQSSVAQTNRDWRVEFLIVITSVGTNGTARAVAVTHEHTSLGTGSLTVGENSSGATDVANINTTIATTMVVTGIINTATGTPHLRTLGAVAELVRK